MFSNEAKKEILKLIDMRIVELGLLKVDCLLPWTGRINKECCSGIVRNKGLYTQCLSVKKNEDELCKSCSKKAKNSNNLVMRVECRSDPDWRSDKGKKPISYSRYLKENNITRKEAELNALSLGVELDELHFVEEKRGRKKKKSAIVSDSDSDEENVEKRRRGRPQKKKTDVLNDLLKESSESKVSKVKKSKVSKVKKSKVSKVTKDADVSLEKDSLKLFYGVVDNRKEKQSVLWRTKLNEHYTIKQFKIQPKSWPNSKGGLYKCNADEIDAKTLVEIKDHIEKNYKIINKAKTNDIVNQFKNKTLKDENLITTEDETEDDKVIKAVDATVIEQPITAEDDKVIKAVDETVIEQPITAEDDKVIKAVDETVIEQPITTAEDDKVIKAVDETVIEQPITTAEDDTLEIDQISLGGLSDDDEDDEDEGEDDSMEIEQQSVTSLSDHENEEDVEDYQVNMDLDENDDGEHDLGNISDFLDETDIEEDDEEETSMKPFYIKQSGFTFMGEIVEERTSVIKYTICTKTNTVYDENDREIGTWNPTDKSFTPK
jgi:hypothetical protein